METKEKCSINIKWISDFNEWQLNLVNNPVIYDPTLAINHFISLEQSFNVKQEKSRTIATIKTRMTTNNL